MDNFTPPLTLVNIPCVVASNDLIIVEEEDRVKKVPVNLKAELGGNRVQVGNVPQRGYRRMRCLSLGGLPKMEVRAKRMFRMTTYGHKRPSSGRMWKVRNPRIYA